MGEVGVGSKLQRLLKHSSTLASATRIAALASQFLVVILLSLLMPKESFGDLMIVWGIYRLLSMGVGTGFGHLVTYKTSRAPEDLPSDIRLVRTLSAICLAIFLPVTVGFVFFAEGLASVFGKPGMSFWLVSLAPLLPLGALTLVSSGSLDGRSKVTASIVYYELLPQIIRVLALLTCAVFSLPLSVVGVVMWLSVLVPWLVESYRLISPSVSGWGGVDAWGWRYSSLLAINTWAGQHLQGVDVVVVGYLFSSSASADYALAVRFAVLFPFFQFIFARNAAPKLGALVRDVSTREINVQLQQIRTLSMFSVCALVSGALLIAPVLIALVGTFDQTVHLMMALAIPALFRSAFAGVDVVLRMTGRPGVSALTAIAGLVLVVLFPATFGHYFGIMSVPFAMSMYAITINSILFVVLKGEGIIVTTRSEVFKAILSSSTLFFGIFFGSDLFLVLISVVGPLFVFLYISFRLLRNSDLRAQFAPKM